MTAEIPTPSRGGWVFSNVYTPEWRSVQSLSRIIQS
jgi:hypothetical protein